MDLLLLTRIRIELIRRFVPTRMARVLTAPDNGVFVQYRPPTGTTFSRN